MDAIELFALAAETRANQLARRKALLPEGTAPVSLSRARKDQSAPGQLFAAQEQRLRAEALELHADAAELKVPLPDCPRPSHPPPRLADAQP